MKKFFRHCFIIMSQVVIQWLLTYSRKVDVSLETIVNIQIYGFDRKISVMTVKKLFIHYAESSSKTVMRIDAHHALMAHLMINARLLQR